MGIFSRLIHIIKTDINSAIEKARISDAERELDQLKRKPIIRNPHTPIPQIDNMSTEDINIVSDYKLLGIKQNSTLNEIDKAWHALAKRADPKRFPEGSEEEKRAAEILTTINSAYKRIRESKNPTEGRFGNLEL